MATTPRYSKRSLPKAVWDSICQLSFGPLGEYIWGEWRAVRKYPGILVLAVVLTAAVTWFAGRYWPSKALYHGSTGASLYFPGDGGEPKAIAKANLFQLSHYEAAMQATIPKDGESVLTADVRFWTVTLIFEKEIDAENSILSASGLTKKSRVEIKDFNRRFALVVITPATTDIAAGRGFQPKGILEVVVQPRTTERRTP